MIQTLNVTSNNDSDTNVTSNNDPDTKCNVK